MERKMFENGVKYPFASMQVGDWFFMDALCKGKKGIRNYAYQSGIRLGMRFSCGKTMYGVTVTRVE